MAMAQQRQRRRGSIAAIGLLLGLSALIVTVYMIGGSNGGNPEVASDQSEPSAAATDQTSLTRPVDALEAEDVSVPGLLQPREPDQASDSFFALHVADDMGRADLQRKRAAGVPGISSARANAENGRPRESHLSSSRGSGAGPRACRARRL